MAEVKCPNNRCEIPAGYIQMGDKNGDANEKPIKRVYVSAYKLGKTEVTVGEYFRYYKALGKRLYVDQEKLGFSVPRLTPLEGHPGEALFEGDTGEGIYTPDYSENRKWDNYPIGGLDYEAMRAYCQFFGGDLMTAAQYVRAARGISGKDQYGTPIDKAVIRENGHQFVAPVCGPNDERANSFGVCDLAGNAEEATRDKYDKKFYSRMLSKNPHNLVTDPNAQAVELRGGSWSSGRKDVRVGRRRGHKISKGIDAALGFRCAWSADKK